MKIEDIKAFVTAVDHGSISDAARVLDLTQSAATRRIQNLEEDLRIELLDRSTKPPRPSLLGMRVYEQCKVVLREMNNLRNVASVDARPSGILRLGITHSIGAVGVVDAVSQLKAEFPDLNVQLSAGWSTQLVEKAAGNEIDAAAVLLPASTTLPERVAGEQLYDMDLVVVAAKGEFTQRPLNLADIFLKGWVLNPTGCGFRAALQRTLAGEGLPLRINLEAFGTDLQLSLVAQGFGLGLLPAPLVTSSEHAVALDILPIADFKFGTNIWIIHPTSPGNLEQPIRQFGAAIAAGFRERAKNNRPGSGSIVEFC